MPTVALHPWPAEEVEARLVSAFRLLPGTPIYSPRRGEFVALDPDLPTAALDIIAVTQHALGRESPGRVILLLWARAIATEGAVGGSIAAWCADHGMDRSTFDRRRRAASVKVAAWLARKIEAARAKEEA